MLPSAEPLTNYLPLQDEAMTLVAGMKPEELSYKLNELFLRADSDNSGMLTRAEFLRCLRSEELNLSRQQINMMMGEFETDNNGLLTYEEFVPIAIDVLLESSKSAIENQRLTGRVNTIYHHFIFSLFVNLS